MSDTPRHLCTKPYSDPERCRPEDCPGCAHERLVAELERVVGGFVRHHWGDLELDWDPDEETET